MNIDFGIWVKTETDPQTPKLIDHSIDNVTEINEFERLQLIDLLLRGRDSTEITPILAYINEKYNES